MRAKVPSPANTRRRGIPQMAAQLIRVRIETPVDPHPDLSYLEQDYAEVRSPVTRRLYRKQDRERLAAYNRGGWYAIGIRVAAEVQLGGTVQTFRSPGVWGVE